jgi:biopolymer transport protein ExbD
MMKRFHKSRSEQEGNPGLDISSLIDVCFLLLIYFLVATTIQKKEMDVPLQLPGDPEFSAVPRDVDPLLIQIDAQGAIHAGAASSREALDADASSREVPLLLNRLRQFADGARAGNGVPLVQVQIDNGANQQRVMDVLNAFVATKIMNVTFSDVVDP